MLDGPFWIIMKYFHSTFASATEKLTISTARAQIPTLFPPKLLLDVSIFFNPPGLGRFKKTAEKITEKLPFVCLFKEDECI